LHSPTSNNFRFPGTLKELREKILWSEVLKDKFCLTLSLSKGVGRNFAHHPRCCERGKAISGFNQGDCFRLSPSQ